MADSNVFLDKIERAIGSLRFGPEPAELYDPICYTLSLGGKRLRPLLTLISCEMFGGNVDRAIPPAVGLELFHNFTLLHDDIMDQAPLRRGKETVYQRWNTNRAILSGDTLFVLAYEQICNADPELLPDILFLFNTTARQVCEGQQVDMNFESRTEVTIPEYMEMIRLKTAVLIACSLKLGSILAGAPDTMSSSLYHFGENLGLAFQLQDDYLDVFGESLKFGKKIGGDILTNKKTYLYIEAFNQARERDLEKLRYLFNTTEMSPDEKINEVTALYRSLGVDRATRNAISQYSERAIGLLAGIGLPDSRKEPLVEIARQMLQREY